MSLLVDVRSAATRTTVLRWLDRSDQSRPSSAWALIVVAVICGALAGAAGWATSHVVAFSVASVVACACWCVVELGITERAIAATADKSTTNSAPWVGQFVLTFAIAVRIVAVINVRPQQWPLLFALSAAVGRCNAVFLQRVSDLQQHDESDSANYVTALGSTVLAVLLSLAVVAACWLTLSWHAAVAALLSLVLSFGFGIWRESRVHEVTATDLGVVAWCGEIFVLLASA
jgi:cobalamin synthase